jgi:hypothetical protein
VVIISPSRGPPKMAVRRASQVLRSPPLGPVPPPTSAAREAAREAALALEPSLTPEVSEILMRSVAGQSGARVTPPPATSAHRVEGVVASAPGVWRADMRSDDGGGGGGDDDGSSSCSSGGELAAQWVSERSAADRRRSAAVRTPEPTVAWWPNTCVFARRDSLLGLLGDKSISEELRKSRRLARPQSRSDSKPSQPPRLHIKHYSKMSHRRHDDCVSFVPDTDSHDVVDTFTKPMRDSHLAALRELPSGCRPENMPHNASASFRRPGPQGTVKEIPRCPSHIAVVHGVPAIPHLPDEARASSRASAMFSSASRRLSTEMSVLESRQQANEQKAVVAARHSYKDVSCLYLLSSACTISAY